MTGLWSTIRGRVGMATLGLAALGCNDVSTSPLDQSPPDRPVPLIDLRGTYLGFEGGLYEEGTDQPAADHTAAGLAAADRILPLDLQGNPDPAGKIVLLSVGMSNTTQEFCAGPPTACAPWSFAGQAAADPAVDHGRLVIVDGAVGGHTAEDWDSPSDPVYDRVRDQRLTALGVTEAQVQIAWVKQVNPRPSVSLPAVEADAFRLEASLGDIVRTLRVRYPSLRQIFLSSRTYAGYATTTLNPEPYAYETGFAVKWLVTAQIEQARTGRIDSESGDLSPERTAWVAWGPYLWADGETPRADGLIWLREDFAGDGTHPSRSGQEKVGRLLLDFFATSPFSRCWFLSSGC
jgi:hypothetical protein